MERLFTRVYFSFLHVKDYREVRLASSSQTHRFLCSGYIVCVYSVCVIYSGCVNHILMAVVLVMCLQRLLVLYMHLLRLSPHSVRVYTINFPPETQKALVFLGRHCIWHLVIATHSSCSLRNRELKTNLHSTLLFPRCNSSQFSRHQPSANVARPLSLLPLEAS